MIKYNPYRFWHQSANFRKPTNTKDHKSRQSVGFGILCVRRLPEDGSLVLKHVVVILIINCFMNCILLSVFIGQYTKHKKMHKMSNIKFMNESLYITVLVLYRVSQEERAKLREGVPYVKLYRYNPKHLCLKLNGYGDNGQRSLKL